MATFFGETIIGPEITDSSMLPARHRKAILVKTTNLFGPPAKFLKFHKFENWGERAAGNAYGINGV